MKEKIEELEKMLKDLYTWYKIENDLWKIEEDNWSSQMKAALKLIEEIKGERKD